MPERVRHPGGIHVSRLLTPCLLFRPEHGDIWHVLGEVNEYDELKRYEADCGVFFDIPLDADVLTTKDAHEADMCQNCIKVAESEGGRIVER